MARRQSIPVDPRGRLVRLVPALFIALLPLTLFGQSPVQREGAATSWADDIIKQEGYAVPPKDLADAVLAPRHLNVALSNLSPDKKWFADEIGDGPVTMKTFSKPFHELGGIFVDYKANRSRLVTIRNNAGVQLISAADGSKKAIQLPPVPASRVPSGRLTAPASPFSSTAKTPRISGSRTSRPARPGR